MVVIQSANKKNQQEKADTKITCRWGRAYWGKENIPEGFSFKKKKCTHQLGCSSPPFGVLCVFLSGIPLAILFLVSFPLFNHKELEQERTEAANQGSDRLKCNQACLWSTTVSVLVNSIVLPGQPPKQFYNLAAGTKLPFALLTAKYLQQLISHPCL